MSAKAPPAFTIAAESPSQPDVLALLELHLEEMHRCSPSCKVNALPATKLAEPGVTFFAARVDGELAAVGAIRRMDDHRCELKSMRASPEWRGRGAGLAILSRLLDEARSRGCTWVGLETGRHPVFSPAHRLYEKHGFHECAAFGDYVSDDFSMCMELNLETA